jgi:2-polyprenyl-3-methyl-5-hydroxy-6-metoxy-1,4-benzoquinol methylase
MNAERLKQRLMRYYTASVEDCRTSILDALTAGSGGVLLDCGCADGELTMRFAARVQPVRTLGIEIKEELADRARARGIEIAAGDLNTALELPDQSVDVVTANQVIEHLHDTDQFVREIRRVLKPGGVAVISTNNLASWHNIFALLVGAQPFPADVSSNSAIGKLVGLFPGDAGGYSSFTHLRIFTERALRELLEAHGLRVAQVRGVGYYPLPSRLATWVAERAPRHAAYLTVVCSRP